ncbi:hypothetical protein CEXT_415191 [Caerostris extrusa]|uniref:Secreted protein n=1 Tax=Caerostris extrusa TaxID=172846 RepID=A0AAV4Y5T9_CAEEX|nr:hypothetical protein CEXT_415191 [Caerostris extrusa]
MLSAGEIAMLSASFSSGGIVVCCASIWCCYLSFGELSSRRSKLMLSLPSFVEEALASRAGDCIEQEVEIDAIFSKKPVAFRDPYKC